MQASNSVPILFHNHGIARLEYNKDYAIIHMLELNYFKVSTVRFLQGYLPDLYKFLRTVGYSDLFAGIEKGNKKVARLAEIVGFTYIGEKDNISVYRYTGED